MSCEIYTSASWLTRNASTHVWEMVLDIDQTTAGLSSVTLHRDLPLHIHLAIVDSTTRVTRRFALEGWAATLGFGGRPDEAEL